MHYGTLRYDMIENVRTCRPKKWNADDNKASRLTCKECADTWSPRHCEPHQSHMLEWSFDCFVYVNNIVDERLLHHRILDRPGFLNSRDAIVTLERPRFSLEQVGYRIYTSQDNYQVQHFNKNNVTRSRESRIKSKFFINLYSWLATMLIFCKHSWNQFSAFWIMTSGWQDICQHQLFMSGIRSSNERCFMHMLTNLWCTFFECTHVVSTNIVWIIS